MQYCPFKIGEMLPPAPQMTVMLPSGYINERNNKMMFISFYLSMNIFYV